MKFVVSLAMLAALFVTPALAADPAPMAAKPAPAPMAAMPAAATTTATKTVVKPSKTVKDIQTALKAAGFDPGKIDGRIGKNTRAAVKQYQTSKNMKATGRIDRATRVALIGEPAKPMKPAKPVKPAPKKM